MPKIKSAKRTAKRLKVTQAHAAIQKMEKGFLQAPAKLAAIINKEITKLSRQTEKQKKVAAKLTTRISNKATRLKSPADVKTSIAKKKAKLTQKAHQYDVNALDALHAQLDANVESLNTLTKQHSKLVALDKQLIQFEKEWEKNSNKSTTITKANPEKIKDKFKKNAALAEAVDKRSAEALEEHDIAEVMA